MNVYHRCQRHHELFTTINLSPVTTTPVNNITGDNDTGEKLIAGDKNKDAKEVGSCQG